MSLSTLLLYSLSLLALFLFLSYFETAGLLVRTFFCLGCSPMGSSVCTSTYNHNESVKIDCYYSQGIKVSRRAGLTSFSFLSPSWLIVTSVLVPAEVFIVSLHNKVLISRHFNLSSYKYRLSSNNLILPFGRIRLTYEVKKSIPPSAASPKAVWRAVRRLPGFAGCHIIAPCGQLLRWRSWNFSWEGSGVKIKRGADMWGQFNAASD